MVCQAGVDQWLTTIMQHLSHVSKPQAPVLALWDPRGWKRSASWLWRCLTPHEGAGESSWGKSVCLVNTL